MVSLNSSYKLPVQLYCVCETPFNVQSILQEVRLRIPLFFITTVTGVETPAGIIFSGDKIRYVATASLSLEASGRFT